MIVVNPLVGGGLSSAKLALANATVADVLSGKKFYSGSKILQTGSLVPVKFVSGSFRVPYNSLSTTINLEFRPKVVIGYGTGGAVSSGYKFVCSEVGVSIGAYMTSDKCELLGGSGISFTDSGFVAYAGSSYPIKDVYTYSYYAYG